MISGIVLAAGTSSRLGRPKQLLELDGRPLLQHVIHAADEADLNEIVIVLGHEAERIGAALDLPPAARTIVNPEYLSGQSTSLRAGLAAASPDSEAAVVLLGDQPGLEPAAIRKMVEFFRAGGPPIVRALWHGTPGHPVVFARSTWVDLAKLTGDRGARDLLGDRDDVEGLEMGGPAVLDVDTWNQYEQLKETF